MYTKCVINRLIIIIQSGSADTFVLRTLFLWLGLDFDASPNSCYPFLLWFHIGSQEMCKWRYFGASLTSTILSHTRRIAPQRCVYSRRSCWRWVAEYTWKHIPSIMTHTFTCTHINIHLLTHTHSHILLHHTPIVYLFWAVYLERRAWFLGWQQFKDTRSCMKY